MMNLSYERVMKALNFQKADRVPHFDDYLDDFITKWKMEKRFGKEADIETYYDIDIAISVPADEGWPTKSAVLKREGGWVLYRDGWGMLQRQPVNAYGEVRHGYFGQELQVVCKDKIDPEKLEFESPYADCRYQWTSEYVERIRSRFAVFGKVGGPYSRTSRLRGTEQFLVDIAEDPGYAKTLTERVVNHLSQVGSEQLRRDDLATTGIWIFDDLAGNDGMIMSPHSYEKIFYPSLVRMVRIFKEAGAAKVLLHSDGNIESILDLLVEAGIDAINPLEPKAGMDIEKLKKEYEGKLAFIGGMCNARVLPRGSKEGITKHIQALTELGKDGGLILAAHSIGPDIPVENYDWAITAYRKYR